MNILLVISHDNLENFICPLITKFIERKIDFQCFLTGSGVMNLNKKEVVALINKGEKSIVCHQSWQRYFGEKKPPIDEGSQTNLSEMIAEDIKVVSL